MSRFYWLALLFILRSPLCAQTGPEALGWKAIGPRLLADQKQIYLDFPRAVAHGRYFFPVASFLGTAGALIALDQYQTPYFRRTASFQNLNTGLSGTNTSLLIAGIPAAFYLTGLVKKNSYSQSTAFLMAESVADSEITAAILKLATRRARPTMIPLQGNFADTWLDSKTVGGGGFPSGHTVAAFSVASVLSERYGRNHRWVPYAAYGAAGIIGFSRVTLSAHNVSDVFAGAALGYAISHFVVLSRHSLHH